MDCLVTKLKGVVSDNSLTKLGEFSFKINTGNGNSKIALRIGTTENITIYTVSGNAIFGSDSKTNSVTLNAVDISSFSLGANKIEINTNGAWEEIRISNKYPIYSFYLATNESLEDFIATQVSIKDFNFDDFILYSQHKSWVQFGFYINATYPVDFSDNPYRFNTAKYKNAGFTFQQLKFGVYNVLEDKFMLSDFNDIMKTVAPSFNISELYLGSISNIRLVTDFDTVKIANNNGLLNCNINAKFDCNPYDTDLYSVVSPTLTTLKFYNYVTTKKIDLHTWSSAENGVNNENCLPNVTEIDVTGADKQEMAYNDNSYFEICNKSPKLISFRINGEHTYSTLNWSGKGIQKLGGADFICNNLDQFLNDFQNVNNVADSTGRIQMNGTRTTASDDAISALQEKGFSISVPPATDAESISLMSVDSLDSGNYGIAYKDKELIVEPVDLSKMQIYPANGVSVQKFDTLENAEKFIASARLVKSESK